MTFEDALENMRVLRITSNDNAQNLNEATTRLRLIDYLLIDCLGWSREQVEAERYFNGEYADYELGIVGKQVVVEAKRTAIGFELPAGFDQPVCRLSTVCALDGEISAAIDQVANYAQERGIPIAVVCNGTQVIAFVGSRQDGLPPREGDAMVFSSIENIEARFRDFWDALSPDGVKNRLLLERLSGGRVAPPPEKLSARLVGYPGYKNRNPVAAELQILGGLFLEDIARHPDIEADFVKETYCESGALSQYALVSREILGARYVSTFEQATRTTATPVRNKKGIDAGLKGDLVAAALSQRPIILLGDVGVGKSIFIQHLILVDAKDELKDAIVLYVDFGSKPALVTDLSPYVLREFQTQLRDKFGIDVSERNFVRGVYHAELARFARGIYADLLEADPVQYKQKELEYLAGLSGDIDGHLKACLSHIVRGQKRQIVIFLDNIDQRPLDFQENVFLMGQAFAQNWPVTVFLALRPDTFSLSRKSGSLSAYQPRVFTIDPPRVDRVIERRIQFALRQLGETGRLPTFPKGVRLNSARLEAYIGMLGDAFRTDPTLVEFLDNMSNGNIRTALDFVEQFVGSAHVDTTKIFNALESQRRYNLPLHEFLRAVMMQDNDFYNAQDSPIANVFDITTRDGREHFLVSMVLRLIERKGLSGGSDGFVEESEIIAYFQEHRFHERQTRAALMRCHAKLLIASPRVPLGGTGQRFRITTAGAYTIKKLIGMFTYVDTMIIDTPILLPEYREQIHDDRTIDGRTKRCELFRRYLNSQWAPEFDELFDWPGQSDLLSADIQRIATRGH